MDQSTNSKNAHVQERKEMFNFDEANFVDVKFLGVNSIEPFQLGFYTSVFCNFLVLTWYIVDVFIDIE